MKFISILCLVSIGFSVSLSPQLEQRLKAEGNFESVIDMLRAARMKGVDAGNPEAIDIKPGERLTLKAIAICVDFSDNVATTPVSHYDTMLSSLGTYATGSMRDFFLENSYGNVDLITTVVGWLRMPQTYAYYVNGQYGFGNYPRNCQRLTEDAVWAANPTVDFSQYDNDGDNYIDALFIIHAGPGAEVTGDPNDIWSHAWSTYNVPYVDGVYAYGYSTEPEDGYIGVFSHEAGHAVFNLPDLYDYDYDSYGVGYWSVMAFGSWCYGGRVPCHLDAWSKCDAGFASPVVPTVNIDSVVFPRVEYSPVIYKLWSYGTPANEFFMVENRQRVGFDAYLRSEGMLIWHVDENEPDNDHQWYPGYTSYGHYRVALEQSDGLWNLEKYQNSGDNSDPYPGTLNRRNYNATTTPDSKDYDFNITYVAVDSISPSDDTMWADIKVRPTAVQENDPVLLLNSSLRLSTGNPIPPGTTVIFELSCSRKTRLSIYDCSGKLVRDFAVGLSTKTITWDQLDRSNYKVSSGIYFACLGDRTAKFVIAR